MAAAGAAIRPVMSPEASPSTAQAAGSLISKWLAITCSTSSSGAMKSSTRNSKEQPFEAAAGTCLQQQQQQTPVRLSWKAVTVTAWNMRGETVPVLRGVTGFAEPGKLTAIMGPSGSGKTTLLDALCAKLAKNMVQSGEVCVNGCPTRNFIAAYVTQEVTLLGTLTVRETLWYSALLRLPDSTSRQQRRRIVEDAISGMGLGKCADTAVGNWHLRGLSGGERRRLSIAVEILTQPPLLFLDEPTSGLDSAAAYFVTKKLQTLAAQGCTVVCVMHQPGREVFQLLDSLVLMSGGRTIYFGDAEAANLHFAEAGFPCPGGRNPLDHYLRVINEDFPLSIQPEEDECQAGDVVPEHTPVALSPCTSQSVTEVLAKAYEASPAAAHTRARIRSLKCNREEEVTLRSQVGSRASFCTQLRTLTRRSFVNMVRDMGYYWLRLVIYMAICVCLGTLYFRLDNTYRSIEARGATIFFVVGIVTFMAIASFPSFVEDIKVFYQERMNGHYGVAAYVLANTLSSVPMIALLAVCSGAVCYLLVGLHPGPDRFAYFVLNLCFCMLAVESLMMAVTSVVQSYSVGITTATCVVGVFLLVAGFFRLPSDIPKPFWQIPVMYNAFHYYAFQGMMENEFFGLSFASDNPSGLPRISGEAVLEQREVDYKGRGKWANLATVVAMVLLYRLVFFSAIKLSEKMPAWTRRAIPCVRTCWARRPRPTGRPATTRSTSPATRHT